MRSQIAVIATLMWLGACKPAPPPDPLDRPLPESRAEQEALLSKLPEAQRGPYLIYLTQVRRLDGSSAKTAATLREAIRAGAAHNQRLVAELRDEKRSLYELQLATLRQTCDAASSAQRPACIAKANAELEKKGIPDSYRIR